MKDYNEKKNFKIHFENKQYLLNKNKNDINNV